MREVDLFLPFTNNARRTTLYSRAFTPRFSIDECNDLIGISIILNPSLSHEYSFSYTQRRDQEMKALSENPDYPTQIDQMSDNGDGLSIREGINSLLHQSSWNGYTYLAAIRASETEKSASVLLSSLSRPSARPLMIMSAWPDITLGDPSDSPRVREFEKLHKRFPEKCRSEIYSYLSSAFDHAALIISLDQTQNESLLFPLKRLRPIKGAHGNIYMEFAPSGAPQIFATSEQMTLLPPKESKPSP